MLVICIKVVDTSEKLVEKFNNEEFMLLLQVWPTLHSSFLVSILIPKDECEMTLNFFDID